MRKVSTIDELRALRRELAHRKRPLIFNNDGDDVVYECRKPTVEEFLKARTTGLVGTGCDCVFYCTWSSGFGMFTHRTRVGEIFTSREGIFKHNITADLIAQDTDPLQLVIDFCHRHGIEVFWSMRMNDVHDATYPPMFPEWKKRHPELLLGRRGQRLPFIGDGRAWSAVNYGRMPVRERAYRFIEEVCRNYDVDGIEMDFFRHLIYFRGHAYNGFATDEERDKMTGLVRRVRKMTEAFGLRRGRPILVAVRVPDSVEYARGVGLDIERWLAEGLVDILVVGGYFRLRPWEDSIELGRRFDVPVYAGLSESRIGGDAGRMRRTQKAYRARALNAWRAGCNGIYLFNFNYAFRPGHPIWNELGDPTKLARLDKRYFVTYRGVRYARLYLKDGDRFFTRPMLCPERPLTVQPGQSAATSLRIGDNLRRPPAGLTPAVEMRVQISGLKDPAALQVTVNGRRLGVGQLKNRWIVFRPEARIFKLGWNDVKFSLSADAPKPVVVRDMFAEVSFEG